MIGAAESAFSAPPADDTDTRVLRPAAVVVMSRRKMSYVPAASTLGSTSPGNRSNSVDSDRYAT